MSSLGYLLSRIHAPIFGTADIAARYGLKKAFNLPGYKAWALPATVGGLWFIWPAVTDEVKISFGFIPDPDAAAKALAEEEKMAILGKPIEEDLDETAKQAIATAYKGDTVHAARRVDIDAMIKKGDFTPLESEWERFHLESIKYSEDDDDEEEDEDDEDDDDDDDED